MISADFTFLARLVERRSGIVLTESKRALIERRLEPVMRRFGFKDLDQVMRELRLGRESLAAAVTEVMTIQDTSFFRDPELFHRLETDVLPTLLKARAREKRLRIWSAACAGGQEAYSIAMLLDRMGLNADSWAIDLIATDISTEAVSRAARGHFSFFEAQRGLSEEDLALWFRAEAGGYTVAEPIRHMVSFRRFNLLDSFGWLDDLDLVLCRNVLMYFGHATRLSVVDRIADVLAPQGMLVLGETDAPQSSQFREWPGGGIFAKIATAQQPLSAAG